MGSGANKAVDKSWREIRGSGDGAILQNDKKQLAERHNVTIDPRYPRGTEMDIYYYRQSSTQPIVHTYSAEEKASSKMCGSPSTIEVLQEYIPNRLSATRDLTHSQGLYVLASSLQGFHELCYRVHPFAITDSLVGFNQNGETRVWHCPDFASNHNEFDPILLRSVQNGIKPKSDAYNQQLERQLVQEVWLAVKKHSRLEPSFEKSVDYLQDCNFSQARARVAQEIYSNKWQVPCSLPFRQSNSVPNRPN